jgi:hypothetical protein
VRRRIEAVVIHAHHHVQRARGLHRRGHHHALHALVEIRLQRIGLAEIPGSLDDDIAARPVARGDIAVARQRDAHAVDRDGVDVGQGFVFPAAMDRIEVQQMRERGGIAAGIVDLDEGEIGVAPSGSQGEATHAAETVDAGADGHAECSLGVSEVTARAQPGAQAGRAGAHAAGSPPQQLWVRNAISAFMASKSAR